MPVTLLYCEGGAKRTKIDLRLLNAILTGACTTEPTGSKYGFEDRILMGRRFNVTTFGLRDRDFDDEDDSPPQETPLRWVYKKDGNEIHLGWKWERREIENYLIDPVVVQRALGSKAPDDTLYKQYLKESAEYIAVYTASRMALSYSRVKPLTQLSNKWGHSLGGKHSFPEKLTEEDCRDGIIENVRVFNENKNVEAFEVVARFNELLPTCRPGGARFKNYLTFFAGKDLLYGMKRLEAPFMKGKPFDFLEIVLSKLERSPEDIWNWLPEWQELRRLTQT